MLHWLQKTLISSEAADWIDDCSLWAIQNFNSDLFRSQTRLILPDASDFPEKISGPEPMARYILSRVAELSGVAHWPWQLCDARAASPTAPPLLPPELRQRNPNVPSVPKQTAALQVPFVIDQVAKPQDLVASIAHTCAQHILWQSQQTPPGGMAYFEQAAEVLAVFSGFGIMLANSAYTYRGSCARCYNPRANRQAALSESESVYALALFCHSKSIPSGEVLKHLKPYLKSSFKIASRQVKNRSAERAARGDDFKEISSN